ncbi:MAG: sulfotransferase domain-containing protein [Paracoccaceae bacterium]|nr:sulfotransferase domain-containing protein [Paracoccaceae bacterium]
MSFPRAGSHWLRMVIEAATGVQSAVSPLLHKNSFGFGRVSIWHDHDCDLVRLEQTGPMIYLYRDPVDVVLSNLFYYQMEALDHDTLRVAVDQISSDYKQHMEAYGRKAAIDCRSVLLSYEAIQQMHKPSIAAIYVFIERFHELGTKPQDFIDAINRFTKEHTKDRTTYNSRVMPDTDQDLRSKLRAEYADVIQISAGPVYKDLLSMSGFDIQ